MPPTKGTPEWEAWRKKLSEARKYQVITEETRARISETMKGKAPLHLVGRTPWNKGIPMSAEQKQKMSADRKGIPRSPAASAKAAESNRGKKRTPEVSAKLSAALKGKKRTPETKARISAVQKGRIGNRKGAKQSPEAIEKMAAAHRGKKQSPEHIAKIKASHQARWRQLSDEEKARKIKPLRESSKEITNSWLEEVYAQKLDEQGIIYERQKYIGWYKVDFYIPVTNTIVELNGCWWHGCLECAQQRKDYEEFREWHEQKREKDKKRYEYLRHKGYMVEVIWEHDLPRKPWKPP